MCAAQTASLEHNLGPGLFQRGLNLLRLLFADVLLDRLGQFFNKLLRLGVDKRDAVDEVQRAGNKQTRDASKADAPRPGSCPTQALSRP